MATTVRVEDEVKRELDRLHGLVQAETGERLTMSELLRRLLRQAARDPGAVVADADEWSPPTRAQLARIFARVHDWRVKTDVTRIDEELYG